MLHIQSFTFSPLQENTYVLHNENGAACIIDPGCYFSAEEQALTSFIQDNNLTPVLLLNTHCHLDHVFGNRFVHRAWGLVPHIHRLEKTILDLGPVQGQLWGLPFENYDGDLNYLEEGAEVGIGDEVLDVLFTPGHSPGSISFYSNGQKFIIAGDVLFAGSVGRTDLPGGDFKTLEQSIRTKLYTLPPDVVVYPGHGGSTTISDEMKSNPFVKGT